jgi:hypothetical protein
MQSCRQWPRLKSDLFHRNAKHAKEITQASGSLNKLISLAGSPHATWSPASFNAFSV